MLIYVWNNFSKRKNSTKLPPGQGTAKNVYLKENTSVENPVFILDEPLSEITYVHALWHYYYVTDIVNLDGHRCELHCRQDVLATHRADIFNYSAFVERNEATYDKMINDPYLTSQQQIVYTNVVLNNMALFLGTGCFLVQCMTNDGIVLYVTEDLAPWGIILDPAIYNPTDIAGWIESKISQSFDLDVYVGSVKWVPFKLSEIGATKTNTFKIGPLGIDISPQGTHPMDVYVISQKTYFTREYALWLPHPYYDDFRCCNPKFTNYRIYLPGVGIVDLDSALIGKHALDYVDKHSDIRCKMDIDLVSGEIAYTLKCGSYQTPISQYKGKIAVDVPISKASTNVQGQFQNIMNGAFSAVASVVTENYIGAAASIAGTAASTIESITTPTVSMTGGSGNKALMIGDIGILISILCYGTKEFPQWSLGRPLYEYKRLGDLFGFTKCSGASVPLNAMDSDRAEVNGYLNSGFYVE